VTSYTAQRSAVARRCHCGVLLATLWVYESADPWWQAEGHPGWHWEPPDDHPRCEHGEPLPSDGETARLVARFRRTGKPFRSQVSKPV
jgi:hypothetical protein